MFSPDGKSLVCGEWDQTVHSWDLSTQAKSLVDTLPRSVNSAAFSFSPDGKSLAAIASNSLTIQLYDFPITDVSSMQELRPDVIIVSPDGQLIARTSTRDGTIQIYSSVTGALEHTLSGQSHPPLILAFSEDSEELASASHKNDIRLWSLKARIREITVSGIPSNSQIQTLAFSPNGKHLVSSDSCKTFVMNAKSGNLDHVFEQFRSLRDVPTFSSDGNRMVCATIWTGTRCIGVWDTSTGKLVHEISNTQPGHSITAAMSPNGIHLAYSIEDAGVMIYNMESKEERNLPDVFEYSITSLAFSKDGKSLATCTNYGKIQVWDVASTQLLGVSPILLHAIDERLSFSTDGTFLHSESGQFPIYRMQGDSSSDVSAPVNHWRYSFLEDWMMEGERKMLWIPPAFRSRHLEAMPQPGLFVLPYGNGVTFLGFTQDEVGTELRE
ncbi:MAG: hypothetical protein Q9226_007436 [Calogaya cf. arnoldii]